MRLFIPSVAVAAYSALIISLVTFGVAVPTLCIALIVLGRTG